METKDFETAMALMKGKVKNPEKNFTCDENFLIASAVMNSIEVALYFFGVFLKPMISYFRFHFNLVQDINDLSCRLLTAFYDFGRWTRLASYRGDCSILYFMHKVIPQVLRELELVNNPLVMTAGNTRLTIGRLSEKELVKVFNYVERDDYHRLLTLTYIGAKSDEELCRLLGIEATELAKRRKAAEKALREALIEAQFILVKRKGMVVNLVTESLVFRYRRKSVHTEDVFEDAMNYVCANDNESFINSLEHFYPCQSPKVQCELMLFDTERDLCWWSSMKSIIFKERYFEKTPSQLVAAKLGLTVAYVDMTFSRARFEYLSYLNKKINSVKKIQDSALVIFHFATSKDAKPMPSTYSDFDKTCNNISRNDKMMCQTILKNFTGKEFTESELIKTLKKFDILTATKLPNEPKKFVFSSVFLSRCCLRGDARKDFRALANPYLDYSRLESNFTLQLGLSVLRRCIDCYC